MKKFIQNSLASFARSILKKYHPKVVAITGSVGKTSTKDAIFTVLNSSFPGRARKSDENYNNELGVPLAIIGARAAGRSVINWLNVFIQAWGLILIRKKDYPAILILEMAADRPKDIEYLTKIVEPNVSVVTAIGPSHLEFFPSIQAIADEKEKLVKVVPKDGFIILNRNDEYVKKMRGLAPILRYGILNSEEQPVIGEISASDIRSSSLEQGGGINFKINYQGNSVPVRVPNILGRQQIYSILAACAVGIYFKLNLIKITESLKNFTPPVGRMRLIPGIKNSLIIDDTYNAAPASTIAALRTLGEITPPARRKVVILGDMLELGAETEKGHREVGSVARAVADLLITVGDRAHFASDEARKQGLPEEKIIEYHHLEEVMNDLGNILRPNDVILVKGSQGMRMEKIVKDIMAEPLKAEELLVRQNESWRKKS